jgi:hypothetical protein
MGEPFTRAAGLITVVVYAVLIAWLFSTEPQSVAEAVGGVSSSLGAYAIDQQAFDDGLIFFRNDQFVEARAAFARADPALRDAHTQFYIAYSFYRQGWHRTHRDDELYAQGVEAIDRAIRLAPSGRLVVDDDHLQMRSADEVKAELQAGLTRDGSDFNPLRVLESRK